MPDQLEQVRRLHADLLAAWNGRDSKAWAALFAEQGGQVGFDGSTANTPSEIERQLRPIFADHPTARYVAKVREVRSIGPDAALLRAVAGMVPPGKRHIMPERNAIQTLVASRAGSDEWKIEMFHNTPAAFHGRPEESRKLTEELDAEVEAAP